MKIKFLVFLILISMFSAINISQGNANGGYAVVDPDTGVVHGVIVASNADPFENGGTMPIEYMGCRVGCLIVPQSTASSTGNVAGIHGPEVIYNANTEKFTQTVTGQTETQSTVVESSSNTSATETQILINPSARVYEFGFQDLTNTSGEFQKTEINPNQNTSVDISATTKEFICEESNLLCSSTRSVFSNTLTEESIYFNERLTAIQVETKIITEAKNKLREQLSLILSVLERWLLN